MDVYLARQPVFDKNLNAIAYELLFRSGVMESAVFDDPNKASTQVLVNAFSEIGLEKVTGGKTALINIPQGMLVAGGLPIGLQKLLILELLEDVVVDDQVLKMVKSLIEIGYKIALDDFEYTDAWKPLIPLASYIKLDVMALGLEGTKQELEKIQACDTFTGKLVAEKIETHEEFEQYKALGFDYFQGYFLCRPHVMRGVAVPASHNVITSLLSELSDEEFDVDKVAKILSQDPRLSYKLLRVVNSAAFGLSRSVKTVNETIIMLGAYELRRWVSMLAFSNIDNKPHELMVTALVRAKMCELLAQALNRQHPGSYFTCGLLSMLDALLDKPLEDLVAQMPLSPELELALLNQSGDLGEVLKLVALYDGGEVDKLIKITLCGINLDTLREAYFQSLEWANITQLAMVGK